MLPVQGRDAWLDAMWDVHELPDDEPLPRGCVPYLPCPADTVVDALRAAEVTHEDVFIDVGSGLGRVAALAHVVTGAGCIGLEIQPSLVAAARARAAGRGLDRVRFLEGDAVDLVGRMMTGTVFFFYCPFGRERLDRVLDELEAIARTRTIRVCCVGMPEIERTWLEPMPLPADSAPDLAVYVSRR
jgi:SAM-dependent methyltransferase